MNREQFELYMCFFIIQLVDFALNCSILCYVLASVTNLANPLRNSQELLGNHEHIHVL